MRILRYLFVAFLVGLLSVIYNYLIYRLFGFSPDLFFSFDFFGNLTIAYFVVIFTKNFFVGLILMMLFTSAYENINRPEKSGRTSAKGIIYFIIYALFAFVAFGVGDLFLMKSYEGLFVLLTFDGFFETIIVTIPIKFLYRKG